MDSSKGSFFLIGLLVSSTIFSSILLSLWAKPVFGEGFTQEQLTTSLGTRSAHLLIKMVPAIVSTDTLQFVQKPAISGSNSSMSGSNSSMSPAANARTNATSVSIVKGASNPSTQKPYDPSPLNVAVGRTVLWINSDNTAHTVTEGNPSGNTPSNGFDSGILGPGQTFKHAFDKPGTVSYYCTLHPFMLGQVIVK
ncbi:MAG: plastocyanin/azurin family copper-binding protein [Candidatus Nitrosopolaris sp.]